jgi:gamma-glutamyl:cysteine ligase YbdK (ATP-grasp superfamily)
MQQILADGKVILKERVKPEMHQSVVELGTEICGDARVARQQFVNLRSELAKLAERDGLKKSLLRVKGNTITVIKPREMQKLLNEHFGEL